MDMMTDLTLQDFNPLSKHVKYAQIPDESPTPMPNDRSQVADCSLMADVHTKHSA